MYIVRYFDTLSLLLLWYAVFIVTLTISDIVANLIFWLTLSTYVYLTTCILTDSHTKWLLPPEEWNFVIVSIIEVTASSDRLDAPKAAAITNSCLTKRNIWRFRQRAKWLKSGLATKLKTIHSRSLNVLDVGEMLRISKVRSPKMLELPKAVGHKRGHQKRICHKAEGEIVQFCNCALW
jgi:hypothetical protein